MSDLTLARPPVTVQAVTELLADWPAGNPLDVLHQAAAAAGPAVSDVLSALLAEYCAASEANAQAGAALARALETCEAAQGRLAGLTELVTGYRRRQIALIQCLRRRQQADPFILDDLTHALRQVEEAAIDDAHGHDARAVAWVSGDGAGRPGVAHG